MTDEEKALLIQLDDRVERAQAAMEENIGACGIKLVQEWRHAWNLRRLFLQQVDAHE